MFPAQTQTQIPSQGFEAQQGYEAQPPPWNCAQKMTGMGMGMGMGMNVGNGNMDMDMGIDMQMRMQRARMCPCCSWFFGGE